jgi:diphosphate-dependent phosphofructokinase
LALNPSVIESALIAKARRAYNPSIYRVLRMDEPIAEVGSRLPEIGIVFPGGPAPGGQNVIAGISDVANKANPECRISQFPVGPCSIIVGKYTASIGDLVGYYRNLGAFTMTNIRCKKNNLVGKVVPDALVMVGGDDSNTNAPFWVPDFHGDGIQVIGVPKTIGGDILARDAERQCMRILTLIEEGR